MENGLKSTVRCAVDQNGPSRKTVGYGTIGYGTMGYGTLRYGHGRRINSDSLLHERFRTLYDILLRLLTFFFVYIYYSIPVECLKKVTSDLKSS